MSDQAEPIGAEGEMQANVRAVRDYNRVRADELRDVGLSNRDQMLIIGVLDRILAATRTPDPKAVGVEREALVQFAVQYGPRCRDCADEDGVCPATGIGCGERVKAVEFVVDALLYGAAHGFCPALRAVDAAPGGGVPLSSRGNCPDCDGTGYEGGFSGNENSEAACHSCLGTGNTAAPAPNVQALVEACKPFDILGREDLSNRITFNEVGWTAGQFRDLHIALASIRTNAK